MMHDLSDRQDIVQLVDSFYDRVRADDLLKDIFLGVNWPEHMPTMYDFWSSIVLGDQSYQGSPFQKHAHLAIGTQHFDRRLELFTQSVDSLFAGPRASEVKDRAKSIAGIFQFKMGLIK